MQLVDHGFHGLRRLAAPRARLQFGTIAFVFLVCLSLAVSQALNFRQQRAREVAGAWQDTTNLARSLAQHAADTFRTADLALIALSRQLQVGGPGGENLTQLATTMAARLARFPALLNLVVVDRSGACIASGRPLAPGECDFTATENFAYHRRSDIAAPWLGAPARGRTPGTWTIPLSRRFDRADGSFGGMVIAIVSGKYFEEFYETFDIGEHGAILLAGNDGKLLVRRPFREGMLGRDLSATPLFRDYLSKSDTGTAEIKSTADGIVRFNGFRRVADYPLVVDVALSEDEVLAPWRADLQSRVLRTGALVLLIAALGTWLSVQIRNHQRLERAYRDAAAGFRLLAENSTDLIVRLAPDLKRQYVSPASRQVLGYEPGELLGRPTEDIVHPEDRPIWAEAFGDASRERNEDVQATYRVLRKDGSPIWIEAKRRRLPSGDGFVVSTRDVTRRKEAEERLAAANRRLEVLANHDGLTGLANRRCFDETLEAEYRRSTRTGAPLSLIMIDVDRFKLFNDRYGHPAGDQCLRQIAQALDSLPGRPGDLVARYGGEELAIILPNTPAEGAMAVAERARRAVRGLALAHAGSEAGVVTISLGVASLGSDAAGVPEDLVKAADGALYTAKTAGRDRAALASEEPAEPARRSA